MYSNDIEPNAKPQNRPERIRIAVQTAHKVQKQLDLEVSDLYMYIRGFMKQTQV